MQKFISVSRLSPFFLLLLLFFPSLSLYLSFYLLSQILKYILMAAIDVLQRSSTPREWTMTAFNMGLTRTPTVNLQYRWVMWLFRGCSSSVTKETHLCSLTEINMSLQPFPAGRSNVWRWWGQNCHLFFFVSWASAIMTHDKTGLEKESWVLSCHKKVLKSIHFYNGPEQKQMLKHTGQ